jgi:hypothetical protein
VGGVGGECGCGATSVARARVRFFSLHPNGDSAQVPLQVPFSPTPRTFRHSSFLASSLAAPLAQIITAAVESQLKINTRYRSSRR